MKNKRQEGSRYEARAAAYLENAGYHIIERNYRRKTGEIDLIAAGEGCFVFVEVKYRKDEALGAPEEAVSALKQQRIRRTAAWFLNEHRLSPETVCRFDVIAVEGAEGETVRHIKNAFGGF